MATLLVVAIVAHRMIKIVQKEERKQAEAESVTAKSIWNIMLPPDEFIGDLSQVGDYLVYEHPEETHRGVMQTYALRLDNGVITRIGRQESHQLPDPLLIGQSARLKKEFRIEHDGDRDVVAQYHVTTRARGVIAKLPSNCTDFKTVQRLPQNFFALEGLCEQENNGEHVKRLFVVELETRRLTYVSGCLPKDTIFIALRR